ncbi:MAG: ArsA family ATPase [bacterium]|nr:ArsA family ATPase [bacterium]
MRLLLYTGKGGVGKTTTAAATAACAAARGERVLVVSADAAHSLGDVLGERLGPTPTAVAPGLDACEVEARHVIETHWGRVREYLVNLLRHQGIDEVVAEELALLPGAEELATLVSVEDFAASGRYDLIVVDCAPTGSTLRLVTLPEVAHGGMRWLLRLQRAAAHVAEPVARGLVGVPLPKADVFAEAEQLLFETLGRLRTRLLSDETSVRIVLTPESMVIDEARRALTDLALFELGIDAVVMNRMLPAAALEEAFFRDWGRAQEERRAEVEAAFAPLPILEAPLAEDEVRGVAALADHGARLFAERAPSARLGAGLGLRFEQGEAGTALRLPIVGHDRASLDVARIDDELVIGIAGRRRRIALPAGFARLEVERVAFEDSALVVAFGEPEAPGGVPA